MKNGPVVAHRHTHRNTHTPIGPWQVRRTPQHPEEITMSAVLETQVTAPDFNAIKQRQHAT
jgi:hypothetical protein